MGGRAGGRPETGVAKLRRTMSASARGRIDGGLALREATGTLAKTPGRRKKRNMSAEGKARIAEATRKRWEGWALAGQVGVDQGVLDVGAGVELDLGGGGVLEHVEVLLVGPAAWPEGRRTASSTSRGRGARWARF